MAETNNQLIRKKTSINCKGKLMDLSQPKIMGIVNITPDSFFDGGMCFNPEIALYKVEKMLADGADIIDIGGCSTRPGATQVDAEEEMRRVLPVIELIAQKFPEVIISADTYRSDVAEAAINSGASIINDISAGNFDSAMFSLVAKHKVPYIVMHIKGTPQYMQQNPSYKDVVKDVMLYLSGKTAQLKQMNVCDILIDPGFGFGKTIAHNYQLLQHLEYFNFFEEPLVVGISRKSMIYKVLETTADNALNGTSVLNTIAVLKGANILRVHDVKEAREVLKLLKCLNLE